MSKTIYIGGRLESKEKGNVVTGANAILDDTKGKKQNVINKETDDELLRLEQSKQDNLNFDSTPTEDSTNPVTSGGVYTAEKALSDAIEAILLLIPSAATALNKLVDTNTMNSSISTATATFRGTYNAVSDLGLTYQATHAQIEAALDALGLTADNNDFAFVQIPVSDQSQDIAKTERFKFNGTNWLYEYDLNTSGFTAAQWAAINSGITVALVTKLTDLPTATALQLALNAKQDTLTFDNEPTALSQNPVTSGGIYTAIQAVATALSDYSTTTDGRLNVLEGLVPTEASSSNKLTDKAYVLAQILAATPAFKGQFVTLAELQAVASPKAGDLGIVRTKDSDGMDVFTVYQYLNNAWNVFYSLSYHPQTKPATTGTTGDYPYNGMGRVELAKNMVNTGTDLEPVMVNTLTQDMFYKGAVGSRVPNTNTIFVIQYDYELAENITIPDGCVLLFDGGSISGAYTITGANTGIKAGQEKIFGTNVILAGSWNVKEIPVTWFGAKGDGVTDDTAAIQAALDNARPNYSKIKNVTLLIGHTYIISDTLKIACFTNFGSVNFNSDQRPADEEGIAYIKQTANKDALQIHHTGEYANPSRIRIYGIHFKGYDKYANSGISVEDGCGYLNYLSFEQLTFQKFKFGINLQNTSYTLTKCWFDGILIDSNSEVGIAIYIKGATYVYDVKFYRCNFTFTYIKAVHIEAYNGITTPITFEKCLIEACGINYRLSDILEYGGGAITVRCETRNDAYPTYKTNGFSLVNIIDCYFESDSPLREVDGSYDSDYEQVYTFGDDSYYGIKNTMPLKASELIFDCCSANIIGTPLSYTYVPPIALDNAGSITFKDNKLYHQGEAPYYKSVVHINTNSNGCGYMSIDVDASNISYGEMDKCQLLNAIKQVVTLSGSSGQNFTGNLNFPAIKEVTSYAYNGENDKVVVYVDDTLGANGSGMRFNPFNSLRNCLSSGFTRMFNDITVVLLSDVYNNNYSIAEFPAGKRIKFVSLSDKKVFKFNNPQGQSEFTFANDDIIFENVKLLQDSTSSWLTIKECNVTLNNCDIEFTGTMNLIFRNYGDKKSTYQFLNSTVTLGSGVTNAKLNYADTDALIETIVKNTTLPTGVSYVNAALPISASSAPSTDNLQAGANYFNKTLGKQMYWTGSAWVDATGA